MPPEHPIFRAVIDGRYTQGLELHAALARPAADDDRWAGYCCFALGRHDDAKDLLLRAKGGGCAAAALELATVLRVQGDAAAARAEIEGLDLDALAPLDRAAALRERGALLLHDGDTPAARRALEEGWRIVSALGEAAGPLVGQTAQLLGYACHQLGRDAPARHYLDVAVRGSAGVKRLQPLMTRAHVHLYCGRYAEAITDLDEAATHLPQSPMARAHHGYLRGLVHRARGEWRAALASFGAASTAARDTGADGSEFVAELGLATILTALGELRRAEGHLHRAARLRGNAWEHALFDLRDGYRRNAAGDPTAAATLERARASFAALDRPRETAWADLHLADLHAPRDPARALDAVRRAVDGRHSLGGGAALLPELRLLPRLAAFLAARPDDPDAAVLLADRRAALGTEPLRVELVTLGGARLLADGTEVRLGMRRTVELLAFLLARGPARRDAILAALWPDDDPTRAKNYLHQATYTLRENAPWLRVEHDRASGTYAVVCEGPVFRWDAGELKRSLSADDEDERTRAVSSYAGPFLPDVDTEWAREERDLLSNTVITVGLRLMARWSEEGEHAKCRALAQRLLFVDPCDETLVEYLVEATLHLDGVLAAKRTLVEAASRAEQELQAPPDWVDRVARRAHLNN